MCTLAALSMLFHKENSKKVYLTCKKYRAKRTVKEAGSIQHVSKLKVRGFLIERINGEKF